MAQQGHDCEKVDDFAGLARSRPALAAIMTLFMLSLAGIPGTAGFIAKFNIFFAAVHSEMIWLPIVVVLTSVVSVFYYLRIPVLMYMREPSDEAPLARIAGGEALALCFCAAAVLFLGIFPNEGSIWIIDLELPVLDWASESVRQFFGP
jgi:NADH-quinone oxidoreductase subunit N